MGGGTPPILVLLCRPTAAHAAANDVVRRAVEQGAYLVAAPPHDVRVIMQMPRGNLETVAPRALVLSAIASSLQAWLLVPRTVFQSM